ncbi:MAG: metallophosphoesterase family protein [Anaerolineales bacterium]|nr:metallophosphoesterase family protein [Anaerolineales bacterium]
MRIAFISDIHGNFTALQAVVADLQDQSIDQVVCLGDTVSLGPQPHEVLEELRRLKSINIRGNHDGAILDPERAAAFEIAEHLIPDLHWCRERLDEDDLAMLRAFKPTHEISLPNGVKLLAFHGSPISATDIIQATTPSELLDKYFEGQTATVFIGGHSHIQMHRRHGDKLILNSGSVGNAFKYAFTPGKIPSLLPWAEYVLVTQKDAFLDVDLRRVYFDTNALLEIIKKSSLPGRAWWLKQYE